MAVEEQVVVIFAAGNGYCDDIDVRKVLDFEKGLLNYRGQPGGGILQTIRDEKKLSDETIEKLKQLSLSLKNHLFKL
jgi:F-type H+-transporting ATPase subunit alpha